MAAALRRLADLTAPSQLLSKLLHIVRDSFGYEHAMVLLSDKSHDTVTAAASIGYEARGAGAEVRNSVGLIGGAARSKRSMRVNDLSRVRRMGGAVAKFSQTAAECCVIAIAGVGERGTLRHSVGDRPSNLIKSNLRFALESNDFRNPAFSTPLLIIGPSFSKVEPEGNRQAGLGERLSLITINVRSIAPHRQRYSDLNYPPCPSRRCLIHRPGADGEVQLGRMGTAGCACRCLSARLPQRTHHL